MSEGECWQVWEYSEDRYAVSRGRDYEPRGEIDGWLFSTEYDAIRLRDYLNARAAQADELAETLAFYAVREKYLHDDGKCPEICGDEGDKAHNALAAYEAQKEETK